MRQIIDVIRTAIAVSSLEGQDRALSDEGRLQAIKRRGLSREDYDLGFTSPSQYAVETLHELGDFVTPRDGDTFKRRERVFTLPELVSTGNTHDDEILSRLFLRLKSYSDRPENLRDTYRNMSHNEEDIFRRFGRQAWFLIRENVVKNYARSSLVVVHKHSYAAILSAANPEPKYDHLYLSTWWKKCDGVRLTLVDGAVKSVQALPPIHMK